MEALRSGVQRVRESLFFVPAVVVALCVLSAGVAIRLDTAAAYGPEIPLLISVSVSGARAIAGAVAGATITVAAIVFSITALSTQIAASQYSPRAVAGFFEDRFQQLVIGLVVGTFAFSLLILVEFGSPVPSNVTAIPSISVSIGVALGVISVIAIIAYIDHSLRRMRIDAVVRRISEDTVEAIHRQSRRSNESDDLGDRVQPEGEPARIRATRSGWVRAIDAHRLARTLPAGSMARVEVRVGEALSPGDLLATVWSAPGGGKADVTRQVRRVIHTGRDRTLERDATFGIRQLVDIALRALSPGVNDPTTAVDVIQHLKAPLREILTLDPPGRVHAGPSQQRVFLPESPSRSDHIHAAFGEIRLAASGQPVVLRALIEIAADLIEELRQSDLEARGSALLEEAQLAVVAARHSGFPEADLKRVLSAAKRLGLEESGGEDG